MPPASNPGDRNGLSTVTLAEFMGSTKHALLVIDRDIGTLGGKLDAMHDELWKKMDEVDGRIDTGLIEVKVDIGQLKVKSGIWGAIGASIPIGLAVLYMVMKSFLVAPVAP